MLENTIIMLNLNQIEEEIDEKIIKLTFIRTLTETMALSILMVLQMFSQSIITYIVFAITYFLLSIIPYIFIKEKNNVNYFLSNILSILIYAVLSLITYGIYSKFTTGLNIEAASLYVMYANFIIIPFYFVVNVIGDFIIKNKELHTK